jgi:hypothetical protein
MKLSKIKKNPRANPGLWVIFRSGRGYGVSIGDPRDPKSRLLRLFPNKDELRYWARETMNEAVSPDHVLDKSGLSLVSPYYTQWYVDNILK